MAQEPIDFNKVIFRLAKLDALEAAGVDNWDGYDNAMEEVREIEDFHNAVDDLLESVSEIFCQRGIIDEPAGRGAGYSISSEGILEAKKYILANFSPFKQASV